MATLGKESNLLYFLERLDIKEENFQEKCNKEPPDPKVSFYP